MKRVKIKKPKKVYPKIGRKTCRSDFEFQVYKALTNLAPSGCKISYEDRKIPYVIEKSYLTDFEIEFKGERSFIVEAKGYFDYEDRAKHLAIKSADPSIDIRFVFQRDNRIAKNSETRYSDWCNKNGFKFAVGEIPQEWFDE